MVTERSSHAQEQQVMKEKRAFRYDPKAGFQHLLEFLEGGAANPKPSVQI